METYLSDPPSASAPADAPDVEQAVACLRYWHGMDAQTHPGDPTPRWPYETACAAALATADTSIFECLVPTLLLCKWDRAALLAATASRWRGRLRAAVALALLLSDLDRQNLPDAESRRADLLILRGELAGHDLRGDVWDNNPASWPLPLPESFWTVFFADLGMRVNWPLTDFAQRYAQARQGWRTGRLDAPSMQGLPVETARPPGPASNAGFQPLSSRPQFDVPAHLGEWAGSPKER